jgi:hypothetical protein
MPPSSLQAAVLSILICVSTSRATWEDDAVELTQNVDSLEINGSPGSVAVLGSLSFPVAQGTSRESVVGAGYFGDKPEGGRLLALAHTGLLSISGKGRDQWMRNILQWLDAQQIPVFWLQRGRAKAFLLSESKPKKYQNRGPQKPLITFSAFVLIYIPYLRTNSRACFPI